MSARNGGQARNIALLIDADNASPVSLDPVLTVLTARPEVVAVCHAHSQYGKAWSTLGRVLDPITQDSAVFHGQQVVIREPRVALDAPTAAQFADALGDKLVAIQAGHGVFTTGQSVDEAAWWFMGMERACQVQLLAEAATQGLDIDPVSGAEIAALVDRLYATPADVLDLVRRINASR